MSKAKLIRISTVPHSLGGLLRGQLRYMSEFYEVIGISSYSDGHLDVVEREQGVPMIRVDMTRRITPLKDLQALWKLIRIFRKEKPFIVHTHTPKAGTLGMMAAYLSRVPHRFHTVAGLPLLEATGRKRKLLDWVEKLTYRCATQVLPNSFGLRDIILENRYTQPEKLHVIGQGSSNGIDTSHFDPDRIDEQTKIALKQELGIAEDKFVFVFIGRLVTDKGVNELVQAFCKLNDEFKDTVLLMLGYYEKQLDPLMPVTDEKIENEEHIIFPGGVEDVRPYLAISDLLVFPSYREGFPNVVMEAGAMGLASIVTDINGCNEIIQSEVNGKIVPVKDVEELHYAMRTLYLERDMLTAMAAEARHSIQSRYERRFIWSEMLKFYREKTGV